MKFLFLFLTFQSFSIFAVVTPEDKEIPLGNLYSLMGGSVALINDEG